MFLQKKQEKKRKYGSSRTGLEEKMLREFLSAVETAIYRLPYEQDVKACSYVVIEGQTTAAR